MCHERYTVTISEYQNDNNSHRLVTLHFYLDTIKYIHSTDVRLIGVQVFRYYFKC